MNDRRLENRYLCADLVRVDWQEGEDEVQTASAVLEDISVIGACVQVEAPIPLAAPLTIRVRDQQFPGVVTYCVYRDYGYFVGVRFCEETRWSTGVFEPQHLTNLRELGKSTQNSVADIF